MKVKFLSAKDYSDPSKNNGDCILVDNGSELVVYDCGCEEHAQRVLDYMRQHGYRQAKVALSHNDADHFDGIPYLIERGAVSAVYTLLLLKYKDELLERIDDGRLSRETVGRRIEESYANIKSLGGSVKLMDMFEETSVATGVTILGPDKEYALGAVAKQLDNREGNTKDNETIANAVSVQLSVVSGGKKLLLTGDSSFAAIEDAVKTHNAIQLPHHGKLKQADDIFAAKARDNSVIYYVSDNTGDSNGGSDDLLKKHPRGHVIRNTQDGDQEYTFPSFDATSYTGSYFWRH